MKDKKVLFIVAIILFLAGISICFGVAIFYKEDVIVRIERAGVCNPLKPAKEKEVKINEEIEDKLAEYWNDTDKEKAPIDEEVIDAMVGDYKLFVGEDTILFNLDLGYVSFNGKYVDITDDFIQYLSNVVRDNDTILKEELKEKDTLEDNECCSCCPDLKPGESCIDACCPCN